MNLFVNKKHLFIIRFIFISFYIVIFVPCIIKSDNVEKQYYFAEKFYFNFTQQAEQQKYREKWLLCINEFNKVNKLDPNGPWAAAGLYKVGLLYIELYKQSLLEADIKEAFDIFERIKKRFPNSLYKKKVEVLVEQISDQMKYVINKNSNSTKPSVLKNLNKTDNINESKSNDSNFDYATVEGLRVWSNPTYTRIVVYIDSEIDFTHKLLEQDISKNKLKRLYVDLGKSNLSKNVKASVQINDELLKCARAGQYTDDIVRVVVDIKSFSSYKIFTLKNPFRIVMDVLGENHEPTKNIFIDPDFSKDTIVHQLSLGVSKIVIDPGHGGRDYGAIGILHGTYEKNVTLEIANRLTKKIKNKLGCTVIMTRKTDRYLSLEERTAIANTENADLFISIHTNAAKNKEASGIETFFLNLAIDDDAIAVAARENATSTKNINNLESILSDLMNNAKICESRRLAVNVQNSLYSHINANYNNIVNKGVKQAPFYVLLGAQMPSILIETSFISNERECKRLKDVKYQEIICDGIIMGIEKYMKLNKKASIHE